MLERFGVALDVIAIEEDMVESVGFDAMLKRQN